MAEFSLIPPGLHVYVNGLCARCGVIHYVDTITIPSHVVGLFDGQAGWLQPDGLMNRQEPSCWFVSQRCKTGVTNDKC